MNFIQKIWVFIKNYFLYKNKKGGQGVRQEKSWGEKLLFKYRLIIMDETSLDELTSFRLNRLSVFVYSSLVAILLIVFTSFVIIYSPLRQYILGFSETELKREIIKLTFAADSLEQSIQSNKAYFASIQQVLKGEIHPAKINLDSIQNTVVAAIPLNLDPSESELQLRQEVGEIEKYSLKTVAGVGTGVSSIFLNPATGSVTQEFNSEEGKYGVRIHTQENAPVSAIADGVVVLVAWDIEKGGMLVVKHPGDFTAIYKGVWHITKTEAQTVRAGEAVAMAKTEGTVGGELYFELWQGGHAVKPFNFLNFK